MIDDEWRIGVAVRSEENIDARVKDWQRDAGFATPERFVEMMRSFEVNLE
jgi:hypothetical protein